MSRVHTLNRTTGRSAFRVVVPRVTGCTPLYVVSGTLERVYSVHCQNKKVLTGAHTKRTVPIEKASTTVLVLAPASRAQRAIGCDGCGSAHRPDNVRCMAHTPESLLYAEPGYMYTNSRNKVGWFAYTVLHHTKARSIVKLDM